MASAKHHHAQRRKHLRIARRRRKAGNDKSARRHLKLAQRELVLMRRAHARYGARRRAEAAARSGSGPSGLSARRRSHARKRAVQAAFLALRHRSVVHYTQGSSRWQGIRNRLRSKVGQYPHYADCSSLATWCLWNALHETYEVRDIVNGAGWNAGFTGTLLNNGVRVTGKMLPGDLVIYGSGFPGHHVAIYVGGGMVISHGSESGPLYLRWNYRGDVMAVRRYI
jgi:cell wall-associated NlpC family hydrolase